MRPIGWIRAPDLTELSIMKVSVIMPCFNHARFLAESVSSVLRQSHGELELIITDDCSSDTSWDVMSKLAAQDQRVRLIKHERNQGLSRSRNNAMDIANGELIGFCDSDDVWEPHKLRTQVERLQSRPDCDVVYSDSIIIDENGKPTGQRFSDLFPVPSNPSGRLFPELVTRNFVNIQSVLLRKGAVARVGHFDEKIEWIQDWWYWVQISREHSFLYCPEPLARYRVHSGSTNLVHDRAYKTNRVKVFRRILGAYPDLPPSAKADICYSMGIDLCALSKCRFGRQVLWRSAGFSMTGARTWPRLCKTIVRIVLSVSKTPCCEGASSRQH